MRLQFTTTVLPDGQIKLPPDALPAGQTVEVTVVAKSQFSPAAGGDILQFLDALPPGPRSCPSWEQFEKEFRTERESWER